MATEDPMRAIIVHEKMFNALKEKFTELKEVEHKSCTYLVKDTDHGRKFVYLKSEPIEVSV